MNNQETAGDSMDIQMTELLQKMVDEAPFGMYVLDTERKILFWSGGAERITGYSREEWWAVTVMKENWTTSTRRGLICAMISAPCWPPSMMGSHGSSPCS